MANTYEQSAGYAAIFVSLCSLSAMSLGAALSANTSKQASAGHP